ncbi:uncharacterized protein LOC127010624 [Drosophila biarmipes]|uniref:uncharacterized protein LOC127010624 n=1 Tax=Drosophila biarmipes TaxID=125945 RepID=UPI0021CCC8C7|nr:uncharacterized protein LOC127010624 [Drosophila biarmipes]
MPKFPTKRFHNEDAARGTHTPSIARYTNSRALRSVYGQLPNALASQRAGGRGGAGEAGAGTGAGAAPAQEPPRVWNCNKPKPKAKPANRTYGVYAKRHANSVGKEASKMGLRQWAHPPYPVQRAKEERHRQGERARRYDAFYVPFEPPESPAQAFFVPLNDNREMPQPRRLRTKAETMPAEADDQGEPRYRSFQRLLPAGERYALKTAEMASLIAEAKGRLRLLRASEPMEVDGDVDEEPLLPPPPQFAEDPTESSKRLMLQRSRTEILFSTIDCDETLYKYACHLPFVRDPGNPGASRPRMPRFSSQLTI